MIAGFFHAPPHAAGTTVLVGAERDLYTANENMEKPFIMPIGIITENQLDDWVRGHAHEAQGVIVELVWRLVAASSPNPKERRFPLGDSVNQPGSDGDLNTDFGFEPFVPEGRSLWEIGTGNDAGGKATSDYTDRTAMTPEGRSANPRLSSLPPCLGEGIGSTRGKRIRNVTGWKSDGVQETGEMFVCLTGLN